MLKHDKNCEAERPLYEDALIAALDAALNRKNGSQMRLDEYDAVVAARDYIEDARERMRAAGDVPAGDLPGGQKDGSA